MRNYITDEQIKKVYENVSDFSIFARMKQKEVEREIDSEVKEEIKNLIEEGILKGVSISKSKITFPKQFYNEYCIYRELDMRACKENVEGDDTPTINEINFKHSVVGSDETGNGEIFKPFIITAAFVGNVDDLRRCIKLGITDSKNYEDKQDVINSIGEAITGYDSWEKIMENKPQFPLPENIKDKKSEDDRYKLFVEGDFFVSRIITNEEVNWRYECGYDEKVLYKLKKEGHKDVLERLYKKIQDKYPSTVVVLDNIIENSQKPEDEIKEKNAYRISF